MVGAKPPTDSLIYVLKTIQIIVVVPAHNMTGDTASSNIPQKNPDKSASADNDSDNEAEDIFHDARFPAEEEAVSCSPLLPCITGKMHILTGGE